MIQAITSEREQLFKSQKIKLLFKKNNAPKNPRYYSVTLKPSIAVHSSLAEFFNVQLFLCVIRH